VEFREQENVVRKIIIHFAAVHMDAGGWKSAVDPSGRPYFYNKATKETAWRLPEGAARVGGGTVADVPLAVAATAASSSSAPAPRRKALWREVVDERTGKTYWYNRETRVSSWTAPQSAPAPAPAADDSPALLPAGWRSAQDPRSGRTYYYNKGTKERSWKPPSAAPPAAAANNNDDDEEEEDEGVRAPTQEESAPPVSASRRQSAHAVSAAVAEPSPGPAPAAASSSSPRDFDLAGSLAALRRARMLLGANEDAEDGTQGSAEPLGAAAAVADPSDSMSSPASVRSPALARTSPSPPATAIATADALPDDASPFPVVVARAPGAKAVRKRPAASSVLLEQQGERAHQRTVEAEDGAAVVAPRSLRGLLPPSVPGTALSPESHALQMGGYLFKKSRKGWRSWLRRFFVTQRWHLLYYEADSSPAESPLGIVDLRFLVELRAGDELLAAAAVATAAGSSSLPSSAASSTSSSVIGGDDGTGAAQPATTAASSSSSSRRTLSRAGSVSSWMTSLIGGSKGAGSAEPSGAPADLELLPGCLLELTVDGMQQQGPIRLRAQSPAVAREWHEGLLAIVARYGCEAQEGSSLYNKVIALNPAALSPSNPYVRRTELAGASADGGGGGGGSGAGPDVVLVPIAASSIDPLVDDTAAESVLSPSRFERPVSAEGGVAAAPAESSPTALTETAPADERIRFYADGTRVRLSLPAGHIRLPKDIQMLMSPEARARLAAATGSADVVGAEREREGGEEAAADAWAQAAPAPEPPLTGGARLMATLRRMSKRMISSDESPPAAAAADSEAAAVPPTAGGGGGRLFVTPLPASFVARTASADGSGIAIAHAVQLRPFQPAPPEPAVETPSYPSRGILASVEAALAGTPAPVDGPGARSRASTSASYGLFAREAPAPPTVPGPEPPRSRAPSSASVASSTADPLSAHLEATRERVARLNSLIANLSVAPAERGGAAAEPAVVAATGHAGASAPSTSRASAARGLPQSPPGSLPRLHARSRLAHDEAEGAEDGAMAAPAAALSSSPTRGGGGSGGGGVQPLTLFSRRPAASTANVTAESSFSSSVSAAPSFTSASTSFLVRGPSSPTAALAAPRAGQLSERPPAPPSSSLATPQNLSAVKAALAFLRSLIVPGAVPGGPSTLRLPPTASAASASRAATSELSAALHRAYVEAGTQQPATSSSSPSSSSSFADFLARSEGLLPALGIVLSHLQASPATVLALAAHLRSVPRVHAFVRGLREGPLHPASASPLAALRLFAAAAQAVAESEGPSSSSPAPRVLLLEELTTQFPAWIEGWRAEIFLAGGPSRASRRANGPPLPSSSASLSALVGTAWEGALRRRGGLDAEPEAEDILGDLLAALLAPSALAALPTELFLVLLVVETVRGRPFAVEALVLHLLLPALEAYLRASGAVDLLLVENTIEALALAAGQGSDDLDAALDAVACAWLRIGGGVARRVPLVATALQLGEAALAEASEAEPEAGWPGMTRDRVAALRAMLASLVVSRASALPEELCRPAEACARCLVSPKALGALLAALRRAASPSSPVPLDAYPDAFRAAATLLLQFSDGIDARAEGGAGSAVVLLGPPDDAAARPTQHLLAAGTLPSHPLDSLDTIRGVVRRLADTLEEAGIPLVPREGGEEEGGLEDDDEEEEMGGAGWSGASTPVAPADTLEAAAARVRDLLLSSSVLGEEVVGLSRRVVALGAVAQGVAAEAAAHANTQAWLRTALARAKGGLPATTTGGGSPPGKVQLSAPAEALGRRAAGVGGTVTSGLASEAAASARATAAAVEALTAPPPPPAPAPARAAAPLALQPVLLTRPTSRTAGRSAAEPALSVPASPTYRPVPLTSGGATAASAYVPRTPGPATSSFSLPPRTPMQSSVPVLSIDLAPGLTSPLSPDQADIAVAPRTPARAAAPAVATTPPQAATAHVVPATSTRRAAGGTASSGSLASLMGSRGAFSVSKAARATSTAAPV
jgi:hypothetical protein